ncbi:hypothetical protein R3P38DRAFT_3198538 [Favolaschia claudopus]|uniref:Uncharacterized protein n=1 Tax=Favolaschia claudopus TaxID=2862362 RepID=A0AAW0B530_9AGAR
MTGLMKNGGEGGPCGFHWGWADDGHRVEDSASWRIAGRSRTSSLHDFSHSGGMRAAVVVHRHGVLFVRTHHGRLAIHHVDAATDESDSSAASPAIDANTHIPHLEVSLCWRAGSHLLERPPPLRPRPRPRTFPGIPSLLRARRRVIARGDSSHIQLKLYLGSMWAAAGVSVWTACFPSIAPPRTAPAFRLFARDGASLQEEIPRIQLKLHVGWRQLASAHAHGQLALRRSASSAFHVPNHPTQEIVWRSPPPSILSSIASVAGLVLIHATSADPIVPAYASTVSFAVAPHVFLLYQAVHHLALHTLSTSNILATTPTKTF